MVGINIVETGHILYPYFPTFLRVFPDNVEGSCKEIGSEMTRGLGTLKNLKRI